MPVTATEKLAVCPTVTFALAGCDVMEGGVDEPLPLGLLAGLLALVKPAHPAREKLPKRTVRRNTNNS